MGALAVFVIAILSVDAGGSSHKHVTIHVPVQIKQHHHTHTIFKHIKHHDPLQGARGDVFKVLGYTYGDESGHGNGGYGQFGANYDSSFEGGWDSGYSNNHYDDSAGWIDDK